MTIHGNAKKLFSKVPRYRSLALLTITRSKLRLVPFERYTEFAAIAFMRSTTKGVRAWLAASLGR